MLRQAVLDRGRGDRPLLLNGSEAVLGGGWHDQLTKVVGPLEGRAVRVLRDENGLEVAVAGAEDVAPGDRVRLVGVLTVEAHGAVPPEVRGRVRAVQVLTQGYARPESGDGAWEPVPGERRVRGVETCPKWFTDRESTEPGPDGRPRRRVDVGALVTLEVPGTDSWLSYAVREARGLPKDAPPGAETAGLDGPALAALLETFSTVRRRGRPRD